MGKQFPAYRNNNRSQGILRRILHALDYHYWQNNVRKILPHKRHNEEGKDAKNSKNPKTIPGANGALEKFMDAEASHFIVYPRTETSSTHKRSLKARIKALVAEKIRKEDDSKRTGLNFPALLQLERTFSVKHLESSNDGFSKTSKEWRSPIIFFPRTAALGATKLQHSARMMASDWKKYDICTKESLMEYTEHQKVSQNHTFSGARETSVNQAHANQLMQNASRHQPKEHIDVLELFQINEDLFHEYQQMMNVGKEYHFQMTKNSNAKARLTKSGTFPAANLSYLRRKNFKPTTLKDKQTEIWSFPRGVKVHNGPPETEVRSEVFAHLEDQRGRLEPWNSADKDELPRNKTDRYELSSSSDSQLDQVSDEYKPSIGGKQMTSICDISTVDDDYRDLNGHDVTYGSINDLRSTARHRRTSSLNDSLHRYARLFDYSFSMTKKWDLSKSVRLTNEYDISAAGSAPIFFKRNHTLPHGDSSWPQQDENCLETLYPYFSSMTAMVGTPATEDNSLSESKPLEHPATTNSEKCLLLDEKDENLHCETIVENVKCSPEEEYLESSTLVIDDCGTTANMDGHCQEINEQSFVKSNSYKDLQVTFAEIEDKDTKTSPADPILEIRFQEEVASPTEFSVSEGMEHTYNDSHEKESSLNSLNSSDTEFLSEPYSTTCPENFENPSKNIKNHIDTKLHKDANADLNYARDILKVASFNEKGFHGDWYSSEQPLNPLIFDEVEESWWPHESECSQENLILLYHHQLLFDSINELILQINESSFTYYPRALSTSCQVHPLRGLSDEEEVLKNLGKFIGFKSELDQPLDDPVARDLAKADGWMNLQMDSECVALELEDLIFDELLEELLCSWGMSDGLAGSRAI